MKRFEVFMSEHLHMAMTFDKFALLVIFCNGSFFLNCCHVEKMTHFSRRSRIFLGGGPFRVKCQVVDAIQWGGGGVIAEFFRGLPGSTRFSVGGGVVPEFFRGLHTTDATHAIHFSVLSINPTRRDSSVGGGGGGSAINFPLMGPFTFFFFPKGGGRAPWAPPESATAFSHLLHVTTPYM